MSNKVAIIDYQAGNIFSVKTALQRLGIDAIVTDEKEVIASAEHVIFPGVGHASSAMQALKSKELDTLIPHLKQPVLGVCLGMQLMCATSEEGNTSGLSIFEDIAVRKFQRAETIPHMGWNNLDNTKGLIENMNNDVYFVHSYYVPINQYTIATCTYGESFSAALKKNNFYAFQFHPEKSGKVGEELLKRFLDDAN